MADDRRDMESFGLGGILRGVGDLLHQMADLSRNAQDTRQGVSSRADEQAADDGDDDRPGRRPIVESRMTIRSLDGEEIGADFFGLGDIVAAATAASRGSDRAEAEGTAPAPERREPPVEVIEEEAVITAIVELPGAGPEELAVRVEHDMLFVTASGRGVAYATEALLPAAVDDSSRTQSLRNGVLELSWPHPASSR